MTFPILPEPRRKPKQERAIQAVAAIKQACLKILEKEGPQHLTTRRIAEVAGVNVGSLYQYFPNKEAIVAAVYTAKLASETEAVVLRTRGTEEVANRSLKEALRTVIQDEVDMRRRFSQLDQEFYGKYHLIFDVLTETDKRSVAHGGPSFDEWFPTLLERHRARLRVADLKLASILATHALEGALRFAVEERPDLLESEAFQTELLALLLRFLEARPA
jgi:AcrR family transcriptional regulator